MRTYWFPLIGVSLLFSLLSISWWLSSQRLPPISTFPVKLPTNHLPRPVTWVKGGEIVVEIPDRRESWTLQFENSQYDSSGKVVTTEKSICMVRKNNRLVTTFTGSHIVVHFRECLMEMSGGVTVVASLPRLKLFIPSIRWQWKQGKLTGTGKIIFEGERVKGFASGLEGDTTLQQLTFKGNVQLHWYKADGE